MLTVGKLIKRYCKGGFTYDSLIQINIMTNTGDPITFWGGSVKHVPDKYKKYRVDRFLPSKGGENYIVKILIKHKSIPRICENCLNFRENGCSETSFCRDGALKSKWSWNGKM